MVLFKKINDELKMWGDIFGIKDTALVENHYEQSRYFLKFNRLDTTKKSLLINVVKSKINSEFCLEDFETLSLSELAILKFQTEIKVLVGMGFINYHKTTDKYSISQNYIQVISKCSQETIS